MIYCNRKVHALDKLWRLEIRGHVFAAWAIDEEEALFAVADIAEDRCIDIFAEPEHAAAFDDEGLDPEGFRYIGEFGRPIIATECLSSLLDMCNGQGAKDETVAPACEVATNE